MARFLMMYLNDASYSKIPVGITLILSVLKKEGHEVEIFDTTKYGIAADLNEHTIRGSKMLNFQLVDLEPYGVTHGDHAIDQMEEDLRQRILGFKPDLIGLSIMEETSLSGFHYADICKSIAPDIPIIAGGVHCMIRPDHVIKQPSIDIVCFTEGEISVKKLVNRIAKGESIENMGGEIPGLWIKNKDGTIVKSSGIEVVDLNDLPYLDLSLLDDSHLFSPFAGHVYKMTYVESQRGCPRICSYCCNQIFIQNFKKNEAKYIRKKTIPRFIDELVFLKEKYDLSFFQILDDDFLCRTHEDIREFNRLYKKHVNLPFWIQAEACSATEEKIRLIAEAGCLSVSMGIENGNEYILKHIMKRTTPRKKTVEVFQWMNKYGIRSSANVIIGVPEETRETVFDTVEVTRMCEPRSLNSNILAPYYGTWLREYSVQKGYLDPNYHRDLKDVQSAVLDLPTISKREVEILAQLFPLYAILPKERWSEIEKIEKNPEANEDLREELQQEYWKIMLKRGINVDLPGFDYDGILRKRQEELRKRSAAVPH